MHSPSIMSIRASSFAGLFDCALRWQKIHLDKITNPSGPRALIGSGLHAGSAAFDKARVEGKPIRIDDAASVTVDEIAERIRSEPVKWTNDEPNRKEVEAIALRLTLNYCADISPRYEFEAVELTTTPLDIRCNNGQIVRLTGTLDRARVVVAEGLTGTSVGWPVKRRINDLKSGKAVVRADGFVPTKKFRPQVGTYELLYEHTTGFAINDDSEVMAMNTGGTFQTGYGTVKGAKAMLLGTPDAPGMIDMAATMFETGLFPPNPQSQLCGEKYCPHYANCPYAAE